MQIKFLKEVEKNKFFDGFTNSGLPISRINAIEVKYNNGEPLPTPIREFLFLGGDFNNLAFDTHHSIEQLQDECKIALKENNQSLGRPFFAFDQLGGCESFSFIFLDETKEDPDVYKCYPYDHELGLSLFERYGDYTFVSLVENHIYRIKNNLEMD